MGLRGDTLRLGLLPPLRGGRLAWPAPRAWDYPNPALPPHDVETPHTWSPAYGGYSGRRAYLQDGLCVYNFGNKFAKPPKKQNHELPTPARRGPTTAKRPCWKHPEIAPYRADAA